MSRFVFPLAPLNQHGARTFLAGHWRPVRYSDGTRSAILICPTCSQPAGIGDHTIADDGTVEPSVVCPTNGCGFHEMVQLEEWTP